MAGERNGGVPLEDPKERPKKREKPAVLTTAGFASGAEGRDFPRPAMSLNLEEESEAAASQSADDSGRDRVGDAAERDGGETAEDHRADASEDVGVRGDFEFFLSHRSSLLLFRSLSRALSAGAFSFPWARHFDAGWRLAQVGAESIAHATGCRACN